MMHGAGRMRAAHTPIFKLLQNDFEFFSPAWGHVARWGWNSAWRSAEVGRETPNFTQFRNKNVPQGVSLASFTRFSLFCGVSWSVNEIWEFAQVVPKLWRFYLEGCISPQIFSDPTGETIGLRRTRKLFRRATVMLLKNKVCERDIAINRLNS